MTSRRAPRTSLREALVARGLVSSPERIEGLLLAGAVRVGDVPVRHGGHLVSTDDVITVTASPRFVSRAGEKLERAMTDFSISPLGRVCADVGSATGGFSDVLLQRGAARVFAIDVGYGDLHWKVRSDPRVVPIERTNARDLMVLPEPVSLIVVDVSFISLQGVLPRVVTWASEETPFDLIALIKPQFEAPRADIPEGGVITDARVHLAVLTTLLPALHSGAGLVPIHLIRSPILGGSGNVEFLVHLRRVKDREAGASHIPLDQRSLSEWCGTHLGLPFP